MSTTKTLADALYREEIARARALNPVEKLLEGPRLFERARRVMLDGIRHQRPDLDDAGVQALLEHRLHCIQALGSRWRRTHETEALLEEINASLPQP